MGNYASRLKNLQIDKNAVEINEFWMIFNAVASTTTNLDGKQYLSIFQNEQMKAVQLWMPQQRLERFIKNLMIYRHPYIIRFVSTWEQSGKKYLATERIYPLPNVLTQQSNIQICLGLRQVLCSLIFLIEKAEARHLNICKQSIYINEEGSWRLGGFDYVWKSNELSESLLNLAKPYRYQNGIHDAEILMPIGVAIEQFAFATMCEEILKNAKSDEKKSCSIPYVEEFCNYCASHLKNKNAEMRPKLSAILLHPYFNHEFVKIHAFLFELPLKNSKEKQDFFTNLADRLRNFDEIMVASQFSGDLMSRMVLLDPTAKVYLMPYVLRTKNLNNSALFSNVTYKKYLMPHILKMFRLRDAQIRLILLEHFMEFVCLLSHEQIISLILDDLVSGMHDTNDTLVAKTLYCVADLIPILGADTVLNGERVRLFSDGRPQIAVSGISNDSWVKTRSITPVLGNIGDCSVVSGSPLSDHVLSKSNSITSLCQELNLNIQFEHNMKSPRLSPDGVEDVKCDNNSNAPNITPMSYNDTQTENVIKNICNYKKETEIRDHIKQTEEDSQDQDDVWSHWDCDYETTNELKNSINNSTDVSSNISNKLLSNELEIFTNPVAKNKKNKSESDDDLSMLDIQVQIQKCPLSTDSILQNSDNVNFDYFKDMEPNIVPKNDQIICETDIVPLVTVKNGIDNADVITVDAHRFAAVFSNHESYDEKGWCMDEEINVNTESNVD